ncbi:ATP-binding cassette domain-containing protein [Mesoplasma chauliocola]|uniref:ATP-binding cassette domain-containing protein n=1 Tax=Mesoplasma chauliocola TaxID=216427 RepID=UPI000A01BC56|nr:ATP-binding cassette domain-containing protein [Mesoplasma chauliocola]
MEKIYQNPSKPLLINQNNNAVVVDKFHKKFKDINIGPFSFNIEKGKVTALLGSSGSGKSVFLNSLLGATLNYDGNIYINGKERKKSSSIENNSNIGFYSQMDFSLYSITAYEFLFNMCNVMGLNKTLVKSRIEYWLKKFDLWTSKDKPLNAFSWGMKNRMNLILCFIKEPEILILDEPGANLDSKWRGQSYKILKEFKEEFNSTIILTVHNIDEVYNIIENFVILEKGKLLFSGSKSDLNLYKKINVSFEKNIVLAEVEKLLNQHNILTFSFNLETNSLVIGLNEQQTFNDALAILEKNSMQPKDIVAQPINMDSIQKALEDREKPHKPKYEPLKEFIIDSSDKSIDLDNALEFLNKIENKYKNILSLNKEDIKVDLANDLVMISDDSQKTAEPQYEGLVLSDTNHVSNEALTSDEINAIKTDFFDKVQEIKNLKSEISKIVTEQKTEIDLNIDDLKDYFAKVKLESEIIHQAKTNFEDQAADLKVLLDQTQIETSDLEFKKNELQLKIDELRILQDEINLVSGKDFEEINKVRVEFSTKLEDLKTYIENVKNESENSLTKEIELKIQEFKKFENEFKDLVAVQKEILQEEIKDFKSYLTEIQIETDEINNSREELDKSLSNLKNDREFFLNQVGSEHEEVDLKNLELKERFDELKKLQEEIAVATIAEYEEIDLIKKEFSDKLFDLKTFVENINEETKIIQISKNEYLEQIKEFKEYHDEFNKSALKEKESIQNSISELKEYMSKIELESKGINKSKIELEEEFTRLREMQISNLNKIRNENSLFEAKQNSFEKQYENFGSLSNNISANSNLFNEKNSIAQEYNFEIEKLKSEFEKLRNEIDKKQNINADVLSSQGLNLGFGANMQQNAILLKDQELEKLKSDLSKEREYFEQLRREMAFEKEMNEKLSKFDNEMKQRENVLELERIRREIQEEKNKLNEVLLMHKINK